MRILILKLVYVIILHLFFICTLCITFYAPASKTLVCINSLCSGLVRFKTTKLFSIFICTYVIMFVFEILCSRACFFSNCARCYNDVFKPIENSTVLLLSQIEDLTKKYRNDLEKQLNNFHQVNLVKDLNLNQKVESWRELTLTLFFISQGNHFRSLNQCPFGIDLSSDQLSLSYLRIYVKLVCIKKSLQEH